MSASVRFGAHKFANQAFHAEPRDVAEEVAVAISFNGTSHAVLMATPLQLDDLAIGFALSEQIVASCDEIESVSIVRDTLGFDAQVRLKTDAAERLARRRRSMAGPVGCGLCGIENLEVAMRKIETVQSDIHVTPDQISDALLELTKGQVLNASTHAVHGAGWFVPGANVSCVREDVGRHNAVDKLLGALARDQVAAGEGVLVVTSRLSVELVQKAAIAGVSVLVAVSAPTALALREADAAGITVIAVARGDEFEVFTHNHRVLELDIVERVTP
ncbi:MAG: formate dehydrogenase accessory sulfurtransferase FdhD [Rhodobacteraceae bacterium]|nr:formate dehydrogenase accessory sulfurtransferase FdhD [Paracoccaceae bacterium]